jgi:hypothetical protein
MSLQEDFERWQSEKPFSVRGAFEGYQAATDRAVRIVNTSIDEFKLHIGELSNDEINAIKSLLVYLRTAIKGE